MLSYRGKQTQCTGDIRFTDGWEETYRLFWSGFKFFWIGGCSFTCKDTVSPFILPHSCDSERVCPACRAKVWKYWTETCLLIRRTWIRNLLCNMLVFFNFGNMLSVTVACIPLICFLLYLITVSNVDGKTGFLNYFGINLIEYNLWTEYLCKLLLIIILNYYNMYFLSYLSRRNFTQSPRLRLQ